MRGELVVRGELVEQHEGSVVEGASWGGASSSMLQAVFSVIVTAGTGWTAVGWGAGACCSMAPQLISCRSQQAAAPAPASTLQPQPQPARCSPSPAPAPALAATHQRGVRELDVHPGGGRGGVGGPDAQCALKLAQAHHRELHLVGLRRTGGRQQLSERWLVLGDAGCLPVVLSQAGMGLGVGLYEVQGSCGLGSGAGGGMCA